MKISQTVNMAQGVYPISKQIDFDFQVRLIDRDVKWREIKDRLKQAVLQPGKVFSENRISKWQKKTKPIVETEGNKSLRFQTNILRFTNLFFIIGD